jgi:hypothetical protein
MILVSSLHSAGMLNQTDFLLRCRPGRHYRGWRARVSGHLYDTRSNCRGDDDSVIGAEIEVADTAQLGYHSSMCFELLVAI